MKTISVSAHSKSLNELLKKARRGNLILESADGEQFVLARINDVRSFSIGDGENFDMEAEGTRTNKELMKFLDERGARAKRSKGIPLIEVRRRLKT